MSFSISFCPCPAEKGDERAAGGVGGCSPRWTHPVPRLMNTTDCPLRGNMTKKGEKLKAVNIKKKGILDLKSYPYLDYYWLEVLQSASWYIWIFWSHIHTANIYFSHTFGPLYSFRLFLAHNWNPKYSPILSVGIMLCSYNRHALL